MINDNQEIEELEKNILKKKVMPQDIKNKIGKRIFENMLIYVGILMFTLILIIGYAKIDFDKYLIDIKVLSVILCALSIVLLEVSYKNKAKKVCIWGIETLILAIIVLFGTYIVILLGNNYVIYLAVMSYIYAIYYLIKNIIIKKNIKKEYIKSLSDISEIVKKEKPIKKKETRRKRL